MKTILETVANKIDSVGMYRTVTLSLLCIAAWGFVSGCMGWVYYSPLDQAVTLALVLGTCVAVNWCFAALYNIHSNNESVLITALILFFVSVPNSTVLENWPIVIAASIAMASKYLLTYRKQHIVNPAAAGLVLFVFSVYTWNLVSGSSMNTDFFQWWVANPVLFPAVLAGAFVVAYKVRRIQMVGVMVAVGLCVFLYESVRIGAPVTQSFAMYFISFPTLFIAGFMLTEPFTMPPTRRTQLVYGALVGAFSSTAVLAPFIAVTPELALMVGNIYAYAYRSRQKLILILQSKKQVAENIWEFIFIKPKDFTFQAGQYMEWMLPHAAVDSRGVRRYFTIASSPARETVRLAAKIIPDGGSSYKTELSALEPGDTVTASQLAGDFVLPVSSGGVSVPKLGFIAGGIGVTPFLSHVQYLSDIDAKYDATAYYCCTESKELAFLDELQQNNGSLRVIPVIATRKKDDYNTNTLSGFIDTEKLKQYTPDYIERIWYISGPPSMVRAYKKLLKSNGVKSNNIKTDFFPGLI